MKTVFFPACFLLMLLVSRSAYGAEFYFPADNNAWQTIAPSVAGWDEEKLAAAMKLAGERNSTGVVILYRGRILAEQYWDGPDNAAYKRFVTGEDEAGHVVEDVASAQKSVVAILTGMAQERGYLELDDPVSAYLDAGWSRATADQEQAITIRHLLSMNSGLATDFNYAGEPGSRWLYNTPVYHTTMRVLMAATGMDRNELTVEWISKPIGAQHTTWTPRPWADAAIAVGLSTSARDLARFGLMIQAGGVWDGNTVLGDREFLQAMLSPSQSLNPAYGYLWWLNGQTFALDASYEARRSDGMLIPTAPGDLVAMQGAGDRKLYLVPSMDLVVSRLGFNGSRDGRGFNEVFWEALMQAAP